jgi:hypothetical protein
MASLAAIVLLPGGAGTQGKSKRTKATTGRSAIIVEDNQLQMKNNDFFRLLSDT